MALDRAPGTINEIAASLQIHGQIASSAMARLMQFGLVEIRLSPMPALATSDIGREFIRSGRALPERAQDREVGISLVFEKVGHSVLRNRDVATVPLSKLPQPGLAVAFPLKEPPETDDTLAQRVSDFMAGSLRPGEWLCGVRAVSSVIEQRYLVVELDGPNGLALPEGASEGLARALEATVKTGALPQATASRPSSAAPTHTTFGADQFVVGFEEHLERFERIVGEASCDVFVLSTFVASQGDERGKDRRERILRALDQAVGRGVRCHVFYGTSLDERAGNAVAIQELHQRLSAVRRSRGFVLLQRESVGSHAKVVAADDGQGGAVVLLGSCNWLSSPFSSVEVSAEIRESQSVAIVLDALRAIVSRLASASRSVEALSFMASELRRARSAVSPAGTLTIRPPAELTVVYADEHERLLRVAAHDASQSFVCCTNKVGATMVPALFNPAEIAGRRVQDARVYFSRYTGPVKRRHVAEHRDRLDGIVALVGVREPQLHAKFLTWDKDHVIVSSMNWGSQSGLASNRLDEIGLYLRGPGLAAGLLERFEAELKG